MSDIKEIELSAEKAKEMIAKKNAALRLASNRDFKSLVLEGYFKDEAARLVGLIADPQAKGMLEDIQRDLAGISSFRFFMMQLVRNGEAAEVALAEANETLEELRASEGDDE